MWPPYQGDQVVEQLQIRLLPLLFQDQYCWPTEEPHRAWAQNENQWLRQEAWTSAESGQPDPPLLRSLPKQDILEQG